jgi:hypothetical protein
MEVINPTAERSREVVQLVLHVRPASEIHPYCALS